MEKAEAIWHTERMEEAAPRIWLYRRSFKQRLETIAEEGINEDLVIIFPKVSDLHIQSRTKNVCGHKFFQ
ncbi:hypothetical protein SUGI_0195120 [Cryptomeria japonica]|nr:hypothetical protein SUGI_0195120 [Cryptomeria japonica]